MKLLFFCGSLEPGRDGVGDYTRLLAAACSARGHRCVVIALHDPHVAVGADCSEHGVRFVRLPTTDALTDRLHTARKILGSFAPDGVSWQFVAYGFHPRGFVTAALLHFAPQLRGPRCHVMLHELWIGLEKGATLRARATGWLQRQGVLALLARLKPDRVQTSNETYRQVLREAGTSATVAGLFGNVPIADGFFDDAHPLSPWLPPAAAPAPFVAITFGTLHAQWQPADTVDWLLATARRLGRPPVLLAIGRVGTHAADILDAFRHRGVAVTATGELPPTTVSHLLRAADCGIAPHPWALIAKSGAAAAMLEHGLPVLVPRDDWQRRGSATPAPGSPDPLLIRLAGLDGPRTDRWLAARRPPESALGPAAASLLAALALPS